MAPDCAIPRDYLSDTPLFQAPKKGINIKNFTRNSPPRSTLQGTPDPVNSLCLGPPFSSKYRGEPKHKDFFGGGSWGAQKTFMLKFFVCLFAPDYCALWGFWCLNMANWVRYPVSPWRACEVEVRYPPPHKRGISAILARYPMKTRQEHAIPPSAILSRKGIARYGGVSRTGPLREHTHTLRVVSGGQ